MKSAKKQCFFVLVFFVIALPGVSAQMVVELGALTQTFMEKTKLDQIVYYVQMVEQQIEAVTNTYKQVEAMIRAEERALENIKGIANVNSYDDFMNWYNRQLNLEHQVETKFKNIGISVGDKTYNLKDIEEIPGAMDATYGSEYWNSFTPAQRRDMWINLGLTPSNYVYQSTWKAREEQLFKMIMTNREMTREDNMAAAEHHANTLEEANKEGTGEKAVLQAILDVSVDTNSAIRKGNEDAAAALEWEMTRDRLGNTPPAPPGISDTWNRELFGSITEEQGTFLD